MSIDHKAKLEKLERVVRENISSFKALMSYINPTKMSAGGEDQYMTTLALLDRLERLVQTDSGSHDINVPTGHMGVKGH